MNLFYVPNCIPVDNSFVLHQSNGNSVLCISIIFKTQKGVAVSSKRLTYQYTQNYKAELRELSSSLIFVFEIVERYSCSKYNNSITQIAKQSSFRNDVLDQTVNLLNCDFSVCSISVVQSYNLFSAFTSLSTQFLIRQT